jgi:molybdopterin-guanine dinucleotide biosynthesis protein
MDDRFEDVTGVVLTGGKSRRMGTDKALLPVGGRPLYRIALDALREVTPNLLLAGGPAERFAGIGVPLVEDVFPGSSLGGLHGALSAAATPFIFALACDMPSPSPALIRRLLALREGYDVVIPRSGRRVEPLCAAYSRACIAPMERLLREGGHRIVDFFPEVRVRFVDEERAAGGDPFANLNTPEELDRFR